MTKREIIERYKTDQGGDCTLYHIICKCGKDCGDWSEEGAEEKFKKHKCRTTDPRTIANQLVDNIKTEMLPFTKKGKRVSWKRMRVDTKQEWIELIQKTGF